MASVNAQRMVHSHQPKTPSGLVPGFTTSKANATPFKLPTPMKSHLPSASVSTPCRSILKHKDQGHTTNNVHADIMYDDSSSMMSTADYGGLEDEDDSHEGAAISRTSMARRCNMGYLNNNICPFSSTS